MKTIGYIIGNIVALFLLALAIEASVSPEEGRAAAQHQLASI